MGSKKREMTSISKKFVSEIRAIIASARTNVIRSVDFQRVLMYWHIGCRILEEEQQGKARADYGTFLLAKLAAQLEPEFGSGFSVRQLHRFRQFYRLYPIASALRTQFGWAHFRMRILRSEFCSAQRRTTRWCGSRCRKTTKPSCRVSTNSTCPQNVNC